MTTDSAPTPEDASEPTTSANDASGPTSAPSASSASPAADDAAATTSRPAEARDAADDAGIEHADRADSADHADRADSADCADCAEGTGSLASAPVTPATPAAPTTPDDAARTPAAASSPAAASPGNLEESEDPGDPGDSGDPGAPGDPGVPASPDGPAPHTSPGRVAPASQAPSINRHSLFARAEQGVSMSAPTASSADSTDSTDAPGTDQEATAPSAASTSGVGAQSPQAPAGPVTFASAWAQAQQEHPARPERSEEEIILDGSVTMSRPASRLRAHLLSLVLSLTLIPFAWFFLHDAAAGLITASSPSTSPDLGETFRFALDATALAELGVGLAALVLALWTARRSSVGAITTGVVSLVAGVPFLAAPTLMSLHVTPTLRAAADQSSLSHDLVTYVWADAASGRFVVGGLLLIMIGVISHSARRAGRREQEIRNRAPKDD